MLKYKIHIKIYIKIYIKKNKKILLIKYIQFIVIKTQFTFYFISFILHYNKKKNDYYPTLNTDN